MRLTMLCLNFAPRRVARNGGELRYWQNASSLLTLGHQLTLLVPADQAQNVDLQADPATLKIVPVPCKQPADGRLKAGLRAMLAMLSSHACLRYYLRIEPAAIITSLRRVRSEPGQAVWAEWVGGIWAAASFKPVVYSHHDYLHRILSVRDRTKKRTLDQLEQFRRRRLKRVEQVLCDRASAVVCVSSSEAAELAARRDRVAYIPIVGPTIQTANAAAAPAARMFLFGKGSNTALRRSLAFLRQELWPQLGELLGRFEWHQVGEPDARDVGGNWTWLTQHFVTHGFVPDLSTVFRPGDGLLMAYPEDTGFRTRFVTAAAYGVVNIGFQDTFLCVPEFENEVNCLMARDTAGLVRQLERFGSDQALRTRLAAAAMALYRQEFSFEAQLPKYRHVLENLNDARGAR